MKNNIIENDSAACVILSFNHPDWTERAVLSALSLHPKEHLFLVHNGSELKWVTQHQNKFPQLKHLVIEINKGFTGGANFALKYLFETYNWVFFQTNDCLLLNKLSAPQAAGLYAPLVYKRKIGRVDSLGAKFWPHRSKLQHCQSEVDFNQKSAHSSNYVPGSAFWIHKSIFSKVGFFDEALHTYWEDVDYSQRVTKLKLRLDIYPQTQLIHGVGKTCYKDPFYTRHLFQRNKKIISYRYTPLYLKPILFFNLLNYKIRSLIRQLHN
jgi:GT2 family glycosyltransferase